MFNLLSFIVFICLMHQGAPNFIVPDEIPSLLSLVYSNIPPIKKGTDSRFGWGFSLGDHADFQVLVELGPQTNTKPLGNEGDKSNKRDAVNNLRNTLYAQTQLLKQLQQQKQEASNTDGGKWLQEWSTAMQKRPNLNAESPIIEGAGEVDASKVIPVELEELYGANRKRTGKVKTASKESPKSFIGQNPTTSKNPVDESVVESVAASISPELEELYGSNRKRVTKSKVAAVAVKEQPKNPGREESADSDKVDTSQNSSTTNKRNAKLLELETTLIPTAPTAIKKTS